MTDSRTDGAIPFTPVPHTSRWPFWTGIGLMTAFFGFIPLLFGSPATWILVIPGLGFFFAGLAGWLVDNAKDDIAEASGRTRPEYPDAAVWFTGFLILSEIFLFGALFASYFYLRHWDQVTSGGSLLHFYAPGGSPVEVWGPFPLLNTVFLVTSSVTLQIGEHYLKQGREALFRGLLAVTIALGAAFLAGQVYEFVTFIFQVHFTIQSGTYGATFFCLTGLHGLHVTAGVLLLATLLAGAFRGQFSARRHGAVTVVGIYWHFVDVIWIFLVAVLYLRLI